MNKFSQIKNALEQTGWSVHATSLDSDCWWAKEIWELRSLWSPQGYTIFLVFLIDPLFDGDWNLIQESDVWAVGITKQLPKQRYDAESNAISITRKFESKIKEISSIASSLRINN